MRAYGIFLLATTAALPAQAQDAPARTTPAQAAPGQTTPAAEPMEGEEEAEDIVITGSRTQPGSVIGDIKPEQQLSPADIRSYGVSSVGELLNELSPQTRSGRGSGGGPVVLINGRRISGFQEIRDLPTEAIQRVDTLPEEVALKYGYRADQRVVNFVLRRRFKAITAELEDRLATEGGRNAPGAEVDLLRIRNNGRVNLHLEYDQADALTEAERDIRQPANATIDDSAYRTLLSQTRTFAANGTYVTNVFGNVGATLNATVDHNRSNGLRGLLGAGLTPPLDTIDPLTQRATTTDLHLGGALNGDSGRWRWTLTGNVDRNSSNTVTQVDLDNAGTRRPDNTARSTATAAGLDALVASPAFALPAGDANVSIRIGASTSDFTSRSVRNAIATPADIGRDIASTQLNLDLPVASRGSGPLSAIGNLSLNGNLEVERLSDFGTLVTLGYGANWSPLEGVRFLASITDGEAAPSATQLGSANVVTPGVRVFDYVTGTTATVTTVTGGNPALRANDSHVTKIGFDLRPWKAKDISFIANYTSQNVDDPIVSFPAASAAIEAAFPDRFVRENGQLLRIDSRPVNFARTEQSQLRYGINLSFPIKSAVQKQIEAFRAGTGPDPFAGLRPPGGESVPAATDPAAKAVRVRGDGPRGGGFGGPGGGGGRRFGGGGQGGGRLQFALYHTVRLTDRVLVADGGPSLDLLRGDAIGSAGGSSRHELEGQAGYSNNGLGTRLSVNYRSATRVDGGTLAAPETLNFGSLATANLRLFADLGGRLDWVKAHPWMRGTRVTLSFDNLLNTRQRVTDAAGEVPIGFQPGYLDPIGRTVRLSIRKLFF